METKISLRESQSILLPVYLRCGLDRYRDKGRDRERDRERQRETERLNVIFIFLKDRDRHRERVRKRESLLTTRITNRISMGKSSLA